MGGARTDGMKMLRERRYLDGLWFDESRRTKFYVVDRRSQKLVATYSADPCFFFHISNVFEHKSGSIVVDVCRYEDASVFSSLALKDLTSGLEPVATPASFLTRFTLNQVAAQTREMRWADEVTLCSKFLDLPCINPRNAGKAYRYVYGISTNDSMEIFTAVIKIDVATGGKQITRATSTSSSKVWIAKVISFSFLVDQLANS
jgi:carotenoid cleavage dioxygenase-like enzyme